MTTDPPDRSYYCNYKFKYLKIDVVSNRTFNCHAARSHAIDFDWLKHNQGQLFNTDVNTAERQQMLHNQRNTSCEENCWQLEDKGAISPRLWQQGPELTHTNIHTQPEILEIKLNDDCNLTCSYCCKYFSSAWRRDLLEHGNYSVDCGDERFTATNQDKILIRVSQKEIKNTERFQILLDEIKSFSDDLKEIVITGGEPFLDNQLFDVLNAVTNSSALVNIYTGLGVDETRFKKALEKIKQLPTVLITVSAECTEQFYEFNRYGNKWQKFLRMVELLDSYEITYRFSTTITNLTVFDLPNFLRWFQGQRIGLVFANIPNMMAPYVLDVASKQQILRDIESLPADQREQIAQSIAAEPTQQQRHQMSQFLQEYVSRRNLDVKIYPKSFLEWLNIDVV